MKNYIAFILSSVVFSVFSQVGIGTITPTSSLDINGTLRVRTLNDGSSLATFPYLLVADASGNVARADRSTKLLTTYEPSFTLNTTIASDTQTTNLLYTTSVTTTVPNQVLQITSLIPYRLCDNVVTTNPPVYHASTRAVSYECILNTGVDNTLAHETVFFSGGNRSKETHYANLSGNFTVVTPGTYTLRIEAKADAPAGAPYRVEHNIAGTTGRVVVFSSN